MDADNWMIPQNNMEAEAWETVIFFAVYYVVQHGSCLDMDVVFGYILPRLKFISDLTISQMLDIMQDDKFIPCGIPDEDEMIRRDIVKIRSKIQEEAEKRKTGAGGRG